jgi:hypothetical protein
MAHRQKIRLLLFATFLDLRSGHLARIETKFLLQGGSDQRADRLIFPGCFVNNRPLKRNRKLHPRRHQFASPLFPFHAARV